MTVLLVVNIFECLDQKNELDLKVNDVVKFYRTYFKIIYIHEVQFT